MKNDMNMLQASVMFSAGGNIHHQLMEICKTETIQYAKLLKELDTIFMAPNTREYRDKLNDFIVTYRTDIYKEFCKQCSFGASDNTYNLKD